MIIDYVDDIYQTMVEAIGTKKLEDAIDELIEKTPAPMNTMLNKQSREEAIEKGREEIPCNLWTFLQQTQVCETVIIK